MNRKTLKGFTEPMRTCIGCRESKPKKDMIRVCCYEGCLSVDLTGRAKGRGVYICRDKECLSKMIKKKALNRGFRTGFDDAALKAVYDELDEVISGSEDSMEAEAQCQNGEHAQKIER